MVAEALKEYPGVIVHEVDLGSIDFPLPGQPVRDPKVHEFRQMVLYFIDVTADYRADFVLFPELFTMQLLSIENETISPSDAIRRISEYEPEIIEFFQDAALKYNINIIGGSHPTKTKPF